MEEKAAAPNRAARQEGNAMMSRREQFFACYERREEERSAFSVTEDFLFHAASAILATEHVNENHVRR